MFTHLLWPWHLLAKVLHCLGSLQSLLGHLGALRPAFCGQGSLCQVEPFSRAPPPGRRCLPDLTALRRVSNKPDGSFAEGGSLSANWQTCLTGASASARCRVRGRARVAVSRVVAPDRLLPDWCHAESATGEMAASSGAPAPTPPSSTSAPAFASPPGGTATATAPAAPTEAWTGGEAATDGWNEDDDDLMQVRHSFSSSKPCFIPCPEILVSGAGWSLLFALVPCKTVGLWSGQVGCAWWATSRSWHRLTSALDVELGVGTEPLHHGCCFALRRCCCPALQQVAKEWVPGAGCAACSMLPPLGQRAACTAALPALPPPTLELPPVALQEDAEEAAARQRLSRLTTRHGPGSAGASRAPAASQRQGGASPCRPPDLHGHQSTPGWGRGDVGVHTYWVGVPSLSVRCGAACLLSVA